MGRDLSRCRSGPTVPKFLGAFGFAELVSACGGGGSGASAPTAPAPPAVTATDAARLLDQAAFGGTASDVASVQNTGIHAYISAQLAVPGDPYTGFSYTPPQAPAGCKNEGSNPPH